MNKNEYNPDDVISYMATIEIDIDNINYTEFLTIQTAKKEGENYSRTYKYKSNLVKGKDLKPYIFINKNLIESQKVEENGNEDEILEVEMNYNLKENNNSIITFEIITNSSAKIIPILAWIFWLFILALILILF